MAVYLSPGVFAREIDISQYTTTFGPLRPAFIGTCKKGPLNTPVYCSTPQQALDTFGEPSPESYLMYEVLTYMEEGNQCYIMRVGVECEDGQDTAVSDVCIDTSGNKGKGWGRIPLFTGIDYGRLQLRAITTDNPADFHVASTSVVYTDNETSTTDGDTTASLTISGTYSGSADESYLLSITGAPTDGYKVDGATYQITRDSDGEILDEGTLSDSGNTGTATAVTIEYGLTAAVVVSSGAIDINDTFVLEAIANNKKFRVAINGTSTEFLMPTASYTSNATFIAAFNSLTSGQDYSMVEVTNSAGVLVPEIRTATPGDRIQFVSHSAWPATVGSQLYAYDIPKAHLFANTADSYDITTANNRVKLKIVDDTTTKEVEFTVPAGLNQSASNIASVVSAAGLISGDYYFEGFELVVPGGKTHIVIATTDYNKYSSLVLMANYSNLKTLKFAEELDINYPYKSAYRGFSDSRTILPDSGSSDSATPLSCELDSNSSDCVLDAAYFENIVGWLVATSPGTWMNGYTATISLFTEGLGSVSGRYKVTIKDANGFAVDSINDVSFDKNAERYIGNVLNPGTKYGGTNGNKFVNWEPRPSYLDYDVTLDSYTVRLPSQFNNKAFTGMADGIPVDPVYSNLLDAAVIGNPAISSGIYAFQNPEAIDINLIAIPGFSSGAVIGATLQLCEARGDVLYLVDPPFGLRPQQTVDWHNGMLLSDMSSAINSSYGTLYSSWIKIFDQFNKIEVWIPPSGYVAGVFSRTARVSEPWSAPAGLRRGRLLSALDVEYSPSEGERDLLYGSGNAVNPIVKFPKEGITIWGQRTLQRTSSALDRNNVRMLLIHIKKNLIEILRNFVHEPNDKFLWQQVTAVVDPFLGDIKVRRGLSAYKVIVDESNNTPEVIDRNELVVSVIIKPTKTAEYLVLNVGLIRQNASFTAEEVLASVGIIA